MIGANAVAAQWLGRSPSDLAGLSLAEVLTRGSLLYWETSILPLLATQGHAWDVALDLRGARGDIPTLVNISADGPNALCVLFRFDERRRYERAMAQAEAQARRQDEQIRALQDVDRLHRDFINTAAHELATPMTPLRLQLHLLERALAAGSQEKAARALASIETSVARLSKFIRDLQTAAQIQSGPLPVVPGEADLAALVVRVVDQWRLTLPAHMEVSMDMGAGPVQVTADPTALERALRQVLDNAAKFGEGRPVDVRLVADPPRIEVRDQGIGVDPARIAELGQPFAQAHDRTVFTGLGAGLGLHIARALMEAQGGTLDISSRGIGMGTTVILTLSATPDAPAEAR